MLMGKWAILRGKEDNLVKDLKGTTLSFKKLGERYGVSRQAIQAFCRRQGIKRPVKPKGHQTEGCRLCQKLIQISKKSHSEFISSQTIKKKLRIGRGIWRYHIGLLRKNGLVSQNFGRLRSKRAERAYQIYFKKRLPIRTIGWQAGLENFHSIIQKHKASGWDVPAPLFKYDGNEPRIRLKIAGRKRRG